MSGIRRMVRAATAAVLVAMLLLIVAALLAPRGDGDAVAAIFGAADLSGNLQTYGADRFTVLTITEGLQTVVVTPATRIVRTTTPAGTEALRPGAPVAVWGTRPTGAAPFVATRIVVYQ